MILQVMSSELRSAELRMQDLVSELDQRDEALHRLSLERDDLKRVVGGLDAERDGLQAELDTKAEQVGVVWGHDVGVNNILTMSVYLCMLGVGD